MPEYIPRAVPQDLDEFTQGYLACAEWCGLDDEAREAFELSVTPTWDADSLKRVSEECAGFQQENAGSLQKAYASGYSQERAGNDFFLTRNGHGAGFWDRGLGSIGKRLTDAAEPYGETYIDFDAESEKLAHS